MVLKAWFVLRYWIGWIIFFQLARLGFLMANFASAKEAGFNNFFGSLFYGFRMDMSMAAYISLPIALLVLIGLFFKLFRSVGLYIYYTAFILLLLLLLIFADIGLYKEWGFRIDTSFLKYLSNPAEAWASVSHLPVFAIIISFVIIYLLLFFVSKKGIKKNTFYIQTNEKKWANAGFLLLLIGLFIIPLRGGFQLAPLNQSSVYFSQNHFSNLAAINAPWNFLHALTHNSADKTNPFVYEDKNEATKIVDSLFYSTGKTATIIELKKTPKPNVIIIAWESFTSKVIGMQREGKSIVPGFEQLKKEGIYFSNIYATGDRTDKGIVGILSGYPAQPTTSIVKIPGKADKLPMLSKSFANNGYQTAFHYGGELEFANMKAYLLHGKFNRYVSINDFDKKDHNSKWGAHDGVVMNGLLKDITKQQQPFFNVWLTLSSHEPYEIPAQPLLSATDNESQFLSSLHYTDAVINDFIKQCKQQVWWSNTVVVIVADHGHRAISTGKKSDDFKIPLLLLGGAVDRIQENTTVGSQTDVAATLLAQLKIDAKEFIWSKNLLDSSIKQWSYFSFNNGFGFIQPDKKMVFDNVGKSIIEKEGNISLNDIKKGKSIQQISFQDYLDK